MEPTRVKSSAFPELLLSPEPLVVRFSTFLIRQQMLFPQGLQLFFSSMFSGEYTGPA